MEDAHDMLDKTLPALADDLEGKRNSVFVEPATPQEYEPLRELVAKLEAEGSVSKVASFAGRAVSPDTIWLRQVRFTR